MTANIEKNTPLSRLYHWEKVLPDHVHFTQPVSGGKVIQYTWREIMAQVRSIAAYLKALDLPRNSQIALLGNNSAHWMMADWAIWMAGHCTVPIYPTLNADTLRFIMNHSESRVVFIGKMKPVDWEAMRIGIPDTVRKIYLPLGPETEGNENWNAIITATPTLVGEPDRGLNELATIVYTSGSTGRPKGVMHSFEAFRVAGAGYTEIVRTQGQMLNKSDRLLSYLPLAHVFERVCVEVLSMYFGCQVFFVESLDTFQQDLQRARPTLFFSVPRLWTKFQSGVFEKISAKKQNLLFKIPIVNKKLKHVILEQLGLEHVRFAGTGSAPLSPETIHWYRELGMELLEGYGMTENLAYSHNNLPGNTRVGTVGLPNPGVTHKIADNGEILIKSPSNMQGYFKDKSKTLESLTEDGFFKTGDMGIIDTSGHLRITGRIKELFKITKGKYVAPSPIENKLINHPKVEAVCVSGANQPAALALISLSDAAQTELFSPEAKSALESDLENFIEAVNTTLDHHEKIQFAVVVRDTWSIENGFLTPTMKIKRADLEQYYQPKIKSWFEAQRKIVWE